METLVFVVQPINLSSDLVAHTRVSLVSIPYLVETFDVTGYPRFLVCKEVHSLLNAVSILV